MTMTTFPAAQSATAARTPNARCGVPQNIDAPATPRAEGFARRACVRPPQHSPLNQYQTHMNITKNTAVTLRYTLTDANGKQRESNTIAYLHGGYDNLFPKVEAALDGRSVGFAVTVDLAVDEAFGPRDASLVRTIPKSDFPPGVKLGGTLEGVGDSGVSTIFHVMKIKGPVVHLDGNQPLAGEALRCTCKVMAVRQATSEEITHRHVHGDHGTHH